MSCNHNCENCEQKCGKEDFLVPMNPHSNIKKVIGIVSGKGGVGKSLVTSLMALTKQRQGYNVAILDGDITGPSIPKAFNVTRDQVYGNGQEIFPAESSTGIKIMSANLLLENDSDAIIVRGPVLAGMIQQFWKDVCWDEVDYMFVDMPPGTGDIPLTVFQSLPLDGIIVVTTPQDLVAMIVEKALSMANQMDIPVLGIVENMSYLECPDCKKQIEVFGPSHLDELCNSYNLKPLGKLPIDSKLAQACDHGEIENYNASYIEQLAIDTEEI